MLLGLFKGKTAEFAGLEEQANGDAAIWANSQPWAGPSLRGLRSKRMVTLADWGLFETDTAEFAGQGIKRRFELSGLRFRSRAV